MNFSTVIYQNRIKIPPPPPPIETVINVTLTPFACRASPYCFPPKLSSFRGWVEEIVVSQGQQGQKPTISNIGNLFVS